MMEQKKYTAPEAIIVVYAGRLLDGEFTGFDPNVNSGEDPNTAKQNTFFYADMDESTADDNSLGFYHYSPWDD